MREAILHALEKAAHESGIVDPVVHLELTDDLSNGDLTSNIALQYAKRMGQSPRELAEVLVSKLGNINGVRDITVAGPGFINFWLDTQHFSHIIAQANTPQWGYSRALAHKQILIEYTDPNPFKAFHIGHLMSNAIGESFSRLIENAGAQVVRANYQGDLGVHVACAIWGMQELAITPDSADAFGLAYAHGATAYKENAHAKDAIDALNKKLYDRSDPQINALYDAGREASLAAFEKIYAILGTTFNHYFFESETAPIGKQIVLDHPEIFVESDGARVFKGEEYGLHTRVFISRQGIPTYEAKELGLETLKAQLYPETDQFIIVTANEVNDYFRVIKQALTLLAPDIAEKLLHIGHGFMRLPTGKMSSRTGDVITGESLILDLTSAALERAQDSRAQDPRLLAQQVAVAAIKFQILRQANGKDIIFDRDRALSLEGDSGPYIQYAYARAQALVSRAREEGIKPQYDIDAPVSELVRRTVRFPSITIRAVDDLAPHIVATYTLELASAFNSWYAQEQVFDGTDRVAHRIAIVSAVAMTLSRSLYILGIPAPEKM